jgi:DNA (cytosine-5)-methyltransferase 1
VTGVYYNENAPFAVYWLKRLIAVGAIPDGFVDERSIADVQPEDLDDFHQCHFFAGIGAWAYALELAEWPDDVRVWTGSCPCQGVSRAGNKLGFKDPRHLWPEWHRLIDVCRPPVVFGEQVSSEDGYDWLDLLSSDLEESDYAVGALNLSAAGAGAPQDRPRLYVVGERLADPPRFDGQGIIRGGWSVQERQEQDRGAGPRRIGDPLHPWQTDVLVACRDYWARPIEPGTRPVAARITEDLAVMSGLGNSIVAPLAAQFILSFIESSIEAERTVQRIREFGDKDR